MDLLELLRETELEGDPRHDWVHLLMPSMGYACGGDMIDGLPDGGPSGRFHLGGWGTPDRWANITCPNCRRPGRRAIGRAAHRQQKPTDHVCDDTCPWTTLPEGD